MEINNWLYNNHIWNWVLQHPSIDVDPDIARMRLIVKATGKATCAEGDEFTPVFGERIAEARAKIKLYKFVYKMLSRLMHHYYDIMYGNFETGLISISEPHSEPPKDCLFLNMHKYLKLWEKECEHLENLINMS